MEAREKSMMWDNFREHFLEKYFQASAKHAKEVESIRFYQGN